MPILQGFDKIQVQLRDRRRRLSGGVVTTTQVGYEAPYAVYVHENRQAHHDIGKAGFLIDPFRRLRAELRKQIAEDLRSGRTLKEAMLRAGMKLMYASQEEVPVDTGFLKDSAFARVEET